MTACFRHMICQCTVWGGVMCTELFLMHMVMDRCEAWQQQS